MAVPFRFTSWYPRMLRRAIFSQYERAALA
jgi:hypothetical protein